MCIGKPESMASSMCISSSLRGLMCIAVYLLVSIYCVKSSGVLSTVSSHLKSSKEILCTDVRYAYTAKGFSNSDVPFQAISGDHLRICDRGLTCCTTDMEHKLSTHSRAEFDRLLRDTIGQVRTIFAAQAQRFDEYFKELLKTSKKDFHEMFLRTYGLLYDKNSFIFKDMFDDLEKYYLTGGVDLTAALDNFFDRLYRKMFQVLNSQYTFNEMYMNCISQKMEELKPFGDVPKKLTVEVKRSFVATRTFVQALAIGRDVVKFIQENEFNSNSIGIWPGISMKNVDPISHTSQSSSVVHIQVSVTTRREISAQLYLVGPTPECSRALMKMTYCPHCNGLPDVRPCSNYCLNVMRGCLAYHAELHQEWSNYINSMMMLASRLESSFNIESVVDPIDIKISDAIMNFQENGQAVSQELFKHCGKPRLGKRDARHELNFETLKFGHRENAVRPTTAAGTSIDRLVQGIKKKIKKTRSFWVQLSKTMCTNPQVAGQSKNLPADECWNGLNKARYIGDLMGEGLQNQTRNPEVNFDVSRQNSVINQQILTLKLITTKLTHAYNGLDVEWQDSSDWSDSSGSGSGSGFGEEEPTEDSFGDIYFSTPSNPTRFIPDNRTPPKVSSATTRWQHSTILICATLLLWSFFQRQFDC